MTKRQRIRNKFGCKCAYCGTDLTDKFHIDHAEPIFRGWGKPQNLEDENLVPACPRCNLWKKTFSVEQFRQEIELQNERLLRNSAGFRLAVDFGIVQRITKPVVFWFEQYKQT